MLVSKFDKYFGGTNKKFVVFKKNYICRLL